VHLLSSHTHTHQLPLTVASVALPPAPLLHTRVRDHVHHVSRTTLYGTQASGRQPLAKLQKQTNYGIKSGSDGPVVERYFNVVGFFSTAARALQKPAG
jgi:hypothetical protein